MEKKIALNKARKKLLLTWLCGSAIPLLILGIQTFLGSKSNGVESQVWSWICPLIFPFITLFIGTFNGDAANTDEKLVSFFLLQISFILSLAYLLIISLVILIEPFSDKNVLLVFSNSTYFITPINGLITACIGSMFAQAKTAS